MKHSVNDLVSLVKDETQIVWELYCDPRVSGKRLSRDLLNNQNLEQVDWEEEVTCQWEAMAVRAIIHGVISNAARHLAEDNKSVVVEVILGSDEIYLSVSNFVDSPHPSKIAGIFNDASAASDWVGAKVLHLACNVCNLSKPRMVGDDNERKLTCLVPLGKIERRQL